MNKTVAATISVGSVLGAGLIGSRFGPQRPREAIWYASLAKPSYTPPGPAIGAAWAVLESLLCVAGYRLLTSRRGTDRNAALAGWGASLAGLAGYPAVFFGGKRLGAGAAVATGMFGAAAATALTALRADKVAAAVTAPLVAWTGFAVLLSEEVWRRN